MKKKVSRQFKFKGVVLACCLAAAMPLGVTTPFEISAMADAVVTNVDITLPAGTTDKAAYVKNKIESALAVDNVIRVTGHANMDVSANSIEIIIPQGKKIIWEASIKGAAAHALLSVKSSIGGDADFEMISGSLKSEAHTALSVPGPNNRINLTVKGGEIISGSHAHEPAVDFVGKGNFNMTGGKIIHYNEGYHALNLVPSNDINYSITGGALVSHGTDNLTDLRQDNHVIKLNAPSSINANVNIDLEKTNIICWSIQEYSNRTPHIKYVAGHDSRDLYTYPGSASKVTWVNENGVAAIKYTTPTGEGGTIPQENADVEDISFPNIVGSVYDKTGHGPDSFNAPDGSNVEFKYKDADGNISNQKPVNAGEYEVLTKLSATYGELEVNLGKFNIGKRPVTIEVPDKEIKVNEALPSNFSDYTVINLANGDNREDAVISTPAFTWGTDGKSEGEFNVSTLTPVNYKNNYKADAMALKGVLKVKAANANPQNHGTQPQNPGTQPQNHGTQPQNHGTQPQNHGTQPQNHGTQPQNHGTQPQKPNSKPSDIVIPGKPGTQQNKPMPDNATPSVPKKPENNGRSGKGGRSGGGSKKGGSTKNKNTNISSTTGTWINDAKGWWYKESNGSYPKSAWKEISYNGKKSWYYFDEQGYMVTGWRLISGKWYYMYEKTEKQYIKGSMAYNTNIGEYKVGIDGAWIR